MPKYKVGDWLWYSDISPWTKFVVTRVMELSGSLPVTYTGDPVWHIYEIREYVEDPNPLYVTEYELHKEVPK